MKNIILALLIINGALPKELIKPVKEDLKSYGTELGLKLQVKTKQVNDRICEARYSAWGIYSGSPIQSYYYRSCLKRYAPEDGISHAIVPPFLYNGVLSGGGYSGGCYKKASSVSVSTWLVWNYIKSVIAAVHEALGHHLGADHIEKECVMHPAAATYGYTAVCAETKVQVNKCIK
jgi:hypothetical protein